VDVVDGVGSRREKGRWCGGGKFSAGLVPGDGENSRGGGWEMEIAGAWRSAVPAASLYGRVLNW
jgi:hypothetical protein